MTTVLEPVTVQPSTSPTQRLRATMIAVRVAINWFGVRKTLTSQQKTVAADTFGAERTFLRVLKSGCKVEERQFESAERYKACLTCYMIIAWRVLYVMMLGRTCPDMPCDVVLTEDEWKSVYMIVEKVEPPKKAPSLGTMVLKIARLGGHLGRKHDGPPGPKTMWISTPFRKDAVTFSYRVQTKL